MSSETATWLATLAAWIAAVVALFSAVVGPLTLYKIAKRQIHASTVSSSRQRWVDALRDDLCELLVYLKMSVDARDPRLANVNFGDPIQFMEKGIRLRNRVALRLNPNELAHQELLKIIDAYSFEAAAPTQWLTQDEARIASATLLSAAQGILKAEWEHVKWGD